MKVSGVSPKSLSRSLTLPQSCNVVNRGKMFHSNSAFLGHDPLNPFLPNFVGIWMLKDPPEAQHRISEDRLLCAEDWQLYHHQSVADVSKNSFPNECCPNHGFPPGRSPIARWHRTSICLEVKSSEFMVKFLNSWEILSHEGRRIHRCGHEHSPNCWMFSPWVCNVRHSFLSTSHLVFYFIHKFCCVTAHDESFGICLFLVISTIVLPRISVEKRFFTMRGNLLHHIPRSFLRFPWSIVRRCSTFPLLRRPRLTIILFWITWWWRSIKFPWSIVYRNRFPKILISIRGPPGLKLRTTRPKASSLLNSS